MVILLLVFGYGTLFGFNKFNLLGSINKETKENILITDIKPLIKNITIKEGTSRKLYLNITPSSASNKKLKYKSMDTSIAIVSKDGKITGVKEGNTTVLVSTLDGTDKKTKFNVTVVKNSAGGCMFDALSKTKSGVNYNVKCDNAKIKEIQYKVGNDNYKKLLSKKNSGYVPFSNDQLKEAITFKVVYNSNNSNISKYKTRTVKKKMTTTKYVDGNCDLTIKEVNQNSAKYDIMCNNATVTKIAYKIGNGSYVGLEPSSIADTVLFEESDVTRVIYFNVEYKVDGSNRTKSVSKSSIIQKKAKIVEEGEM